MSFTPSGNPDDQQQAITEITVTEVSVETRGALPDRRDESVSTRWSGVALVMGIVSLALAPVFGLGVIPAIATVIIGHIARYREPRGRLKASVGLGLSYAALVVGTAVLVLVALPLVLAFLVSAGYILSD